MSWQLEALSNGTVVVRIYHLSGVFVGFLEADSAVSVGQQLVSLARSSKTGLVMPPGVTFPSPPLNGAAPT
jgi:hypothetical protein